MTSEQSSDRPSTEETAAEAPADTIAYAIQRNIVFYRVDAGTTDDGERIPFDFTAAFNSINKIPIGAKRRCLNYDSPVRTRCWIDKVKKHNAKDSPTPRAEVRIGRTQMLDIPMKEDSGVLEPIELDKDAGTIDMTHAVFFPEGIVACEYSQRGPKVNDIRLFIEGITPTMPAPHFRPLIHNDSLNKLVNCDRVTKAQIKIKKSAVAAAPIMEAGNIFASLKALVNQSNSEYIDITLSVGRTKKVLVKADVVKACTAISDLIAENPLLAKSTRVRIDCYLNDDSSKATPIDLFSDKFVQRVSLLNKPGRNRSVNSVSAYTEMRRLYNEMSAELLAASELIL